jgi:hypothetical protein
LCALELNAVFERRLDYDDLLLYWRHAMAEPALAAEISRRFGLMQAAKTSLVRSVAVLGATYSRIRRHWSEGLIFVWSPAYWL